MKNNKQPKFLISVNKKKYIGELTSNVGRPTVRCDETGTQYRISDEDVVKYQEANKIYFTIVNAAAGKIEIVGIAN